MSIPSHPFTPFAPSDGVMLLIDHQVDTLDFCRNISHDNLAEHPRRGQGRHSAGSTNGADLQPGEPRPGPLIDDLRQLLPDACAARIKRRGMANVVGPHYRAAVFEAAGDRKNIIMAGPDRRRMHRVPVQVVQDAGGSPNAIGGTPHAAAGENHGVVTTSSNQTDRRSRRRLEHRERRQAHRHHLREVTSYLNAM